jgi:two-component system nitrogen regulation sensor histidine kinase NtrY
VSFRTRLLLIIGTAVVAASTAGTWILLVTTTRAFEQLDEQRRLALIEQFRRTFRSRTEEIAGRVRAIAQAESSRRMAIDLSRPGADQGTYVNAAAELATQHSLDFLEILDNQGRIISSAHWPARFGYIDPLAAQLPKLAGQPASLTRQELPDQVCIAMIAVAPVDLAETRLYIVGGERLDKRFLDTLALPGGMRLIPYQNLEPGLSPRLLAGFEDPARQFARLEPIVSAVLHSRREFSTMIAWSKDSADSERIQAIPLEAHDGQLLGVLIVASSRQEIVHLSRFIAVTGLIAGIGGVILGLGAGWWTTRRISKPIQKLAEGAGKVTRGNWNTRVYVFSRDEIGDLAKAFNQMTEQLLEQRDRLIQAERVAAWREVARRLAHELKNPLFPLQITLENLQRAKACHPDQFDEVFEESTGAMLTELRSLKTIIARFSEFSKMPQPELHPVDLNHIVEEKSTLFESELAARTANRIELCTDLEKEPGMVRADPDQIGRVLQNLVLNAIDAMPDGGRLVIRTRSQAAGMLLEVEDTGVGLTPEERDRVFTPYYTTKQHGTGLGLAIVQSIISDHGGRIAVESQPGRGTLFRIWLAGS